MWGRIERFVGGRQRFGNEDDSAFFGYCARRDLEEEEGIERQQSKGRYIGWERLAANVRPPISRHRKRYRLPSQDRRSSEQLG
ncbi:hypothetical protein BD309DRAFT_970224 [Dichomitus squalens]|nr:hypothetical protein BD309DRAFT_970224 [Dichomitus squalens]